MAPCVQVVPIHICSIVVVMQTSYGESLTRAVDSSIFSMDTVVDPECIAGTVDESGFSATTLNIVQPDLTNTIGKPSCQSSSTYALRIFDLFIPIIHLTYPL